MGELRFSAVIFDLDGTLIEVDNLKKRGDEILKNTLLKFSVKRTSPKDRFAFWFSGGEFPLLLDKWGFRREGQKRLFLDALSRIEHDTKKSLIEAGHVKLYDDVDILGNLHHKTKLGLVSNSSLRTVMMEVNSFKITRYFDSIVALGDFNSGLRPKPDPDGVIQCLRELGEPPNKSVVVGDNLTDIIAGQKSGTHTALIVRGTRQAPTSRSEESFRIDFQVKTLKELESLIMT